jgi:hypothetical protein
LKGRNIIGLSIQLDDLSKDLPGSVQLIREEEPQRAPCSPFPHSRPQVFEKHPTTHRQETTYY